MKVNFRNPIYADEFRVAVQEMMRGQVIRDCDVTDHTPDRFRRVDGRCVESRGPVCLSGDMLVDNVNPHYKGKRSDTAKLSYVTIRDQQDEHRIVGIHFHERSSYLADAVRGIQTFFDDYAPAQAQTDSADQHMG